MLDNYALEDVLIDHLTEAHFISTAIEQSVVEEEKMELKECTLL